MPKLTRLSSLLLVVCLLVSACAPNSDALEAQPFSHANEIPVGPAVVPLANPDLDGDARREYLGDLDLAPEQADHYDLINGALQLSEEELALLARNGFVVSERMQWPRFAEAYAWIYWQDLPVLVTTDSLLHAVHQSYSDLLSSLEMAFLIPQLGALLHATRGQVSAGAQNNQDPALTPLYADLDAYLGVALALLEGRAGGSSQERDWVALATAATTSWEDVQLFGTKYMVDFTLFEPRGHYTRAPELQRYFRAMSWLGLMDFRMVTYDPVTSEPIVHPEAAAAVAILRQALDGAGQRPAWQMLNQLFEGLVGRSDNMILPDFDRLWADLELGDPASVLALAPDRLLKQLTENDYGQQRITGQLIVRDIEDTSPDSIPRPVSFLLLGQRFALDAYVMGSLVYDRLMLDGKPVKRALPDPLDVMYALGDDRAAAHLGDDLAEYGYGGHLAALRQQIDGFAPSYWQTPIYNQWLGLIRALNAPTTGAQYPQALRTAAWADKTLQTQLASWAQLRHDNLLYVKQSFTTMEAVCEYPAGYVEPYPAFYAALADFGRAGHAVAEQLTPPAQFEAANAVRQRALDYFGSVQFVAARLQTLAEKELRMEPFSAEEEAFLKSIVKRQEIANFEGCAGPAFEDLWDGWYLSLFFAKDDNPAVIADVHTNPTNDPSSALYPPRVLHVATGPVVPLYLLVDTPSGTGLFVGPAFTYFELVEAGDAQQPPARLNDEEWRALLAAGKQPPAPAWTGSFRLAAPDAPALLRVGMEADAANAGGGTGGAWAPESPLAYPPPNP